MGRVRTGKLKLKFSLCGVSRIPSNRVSRIVATFFSLCCVCAIQVASTLNDRNSAADALLEVAKLHESCGELRKASHAASAALLLSDPASVASSNHSINNNSDSSSSSGDAKPSTATTTEPEDWARAWAASKLLGHISARKGHWSEARRFFEVSAGAASSLVAMGGVPPLMRNGNDSSPHMLSRPAAAAIADAAIAAGSSSSSDGGPSSPATWVRREALALEQVALTGAKAAQHANQTTTRSAYARDIEYRPRSHLPVPAVVTMARDPALEAIAAASAANNPNKNSDGSNGGKQASPTTASPASPHRELFLARTFDGASEAQARTAEFQRRGDAAEARAAAEYGVASRDGGDNESGSNNSSKTPQRNDSVDFLTAAANLAESACAWDGGGSGRASGVLLASRLGHQASAARWMSGDAEGARNLRQRLATAKLGSYGHDAGAYEKLPLPPGPNHGSVGPGALRFYPSEASLELAGVPGPGPGHYSVAAATAPPAGGKFSNAVPKTDIDWVLKTALFIFSCCSCW